MIRLKTRAGHGFPRMPPGGGALARLWPPRPPAMHERRLHAARHLHGGAAVLALAVLGDSGIEHYRGSFRNKAMVTPLLTASVSLLSALHGLADQRPLPHRLRNAVHGLAALTGLIGTGFHVYNVLKRPGRLSFENLFYGAPLGAPAAMLLSGAVGLAAEQVREQPLDRLESLGLERREPLGDRELGQGIAALVAAGLLGTTAEAALLHFRGNFQNRDMYLPVLLPPAVAGLLGRAAARPDAPHARQRARGASWLAVMLGLAGAGFHIRGVSRHMGGWRNWSQNLLDGPPIPAPPSFTGLGLAALAALALMGGPDRG